MSRAGASDEGVSHEGAYYKGASHKGAYHEGASPSISSISISRQRDRLGAEIAGGETMKGIESSRSVPAPRCDRTTSSVADDGE